MFMLARGGTVNESTYNQEPIPVLLTPKNTILAIPSVALLHQDFIWSSLSYCIHCRSISEGRIQPIRLVHIICLRKRAQHEPV
jgi:hypothetical protein